MSGMDIYTIGHSNHSIDQFIALLKQHGIEALVDVRRFPSGPVSVFVSAGSSRLSGS